MAPYLGRALFASARSRVRERHSWAKMQPLATLARANAPWSLLSALILKGLFIVRFRSLVAPLARTVSSLLKGTVPRFRWAWKAKHVATRSLLLVAMTSMARPLLSVPQTAMSPPQKWF